MVNSQFLTQLDVFRVGVSVGLGCQIFFWTVSAGVNKERALFGSVVSGASTTLGAGVRGREEVAVGRWWLGGKPHEHTARCNSACVRRFSPVPQPDKRKTHPAAVQPHTTWCAGAEADMTQQGATLQNYNNELVKCTHRPPTYSATRVHAQRRPPTCRH